MATLRELERAAKSREQRDAEHDELWDSHEEQLRRRSIMVTWATRAWRIAFGVGAFVALVNGLYASFVQWLSR